MAWLFCASGAWAAISIAGALLLERRINLDIEILGLWIGPGLLRHQARYRTWALRLLIVGFCLTPVAVFVLVVKQRALDVTFFGRPLGTVPVAMYRCEVDGDGGIHFAELADDASGSTRTGDMRSR